MQKISVAWGRKLIHLHWHRTGYRLRSKALGQLIDEMFYGSIPQVKKAVVAFMDGRHPKPTAADKASVEDLVKVYQKIPKRAGHAAEKINISRLRSVAREVLGRELASVAVSEIGPQFWQEYQRKRQGGRIDLATRRPENTAINSALKCAVSLFLPKLVPSYKLAGIDIGPDASAIQWLPVFRGRKPKAEDASMQSAWRGLPPWRPLEHGAMYWTIGIARFAGLRREEIAACRKSWMVKRGEVWGFEVCDRPDQGFHHKTGEEYFAPVINEDFLKELLELPDGLIVQPPEGMSIAHWITHYPQPWLKPFTGEAKKPLHRLRGLYAEDIKAMGQNAELARLAGIQAAADALGHTSTKTTKDHYLDD